MSPCYFATNSKRKWYRGRRAVLSPKGESHPHWTMIVICHKSFLIFLEGNRRLKKRRITATLFGRSTGRFSAFVSRFETPTRIATGPHGRCCCLGRPFVLPRDPRTSSSSRLNGSGIDPREGRLKLQPYPSTLKRGQ